MYSSSEPPEQHKPLRACCYYSFNAFDLRDEEMVIYALNWFEIVYSIQFILDFKKD